MNSRSLFNIFILLVIGLVGLVSAQEAANKGANAVPSKESHDSMDLDGDDSFAPGEKIDPQTIVDYVINFDESKVKKEEMDAVADWLKARSIEIKENEMASYAAYIVAPMNRPIADELTAFCKEKTIALEEIEPDYLDWSDMEKEEL